MDHFDLVERTYQLSQKLIDRSSVDKIKLIPNTGKRVQMCVSTNLIFDLFDAFQEYHTLLNEGASFKKSKVSLSLLTRYIFESYVNFLYIFNTKKELMRNRTKAYFHYGDYKKGLMQGKEHLVEEKGEWIKYLSSKAKATQWHGKSFQELSQEANYSPVVYQVLSQFSHPTIFTMERVLNTEMFGGILESSIIFTSGAVCDVMAHANNLKLYGLKLTKNNERQINDLVKIHELLMKNFKK